MAGKRRKEILYTPLERRAYCGYCGRGFSQPRGRGRPASYCCDACRQAAYRQRRAERVELERIARWESLHPHSREADIPF